MKSEMKNGVMILKGREECLAWEQSGPADERKNRRVKSACLDVRNSWKCCERVQNSQWIGFLAPPPGASKCARACVFNEGTTSELPLPPISQHHAKDYPVMLGADSAWVFSYTTAALPRLTQKWSPEDLQAHTYGSAHISRTVLKYTLRSHCVTAAPYLPKHRETQTPL